MENWRTRNTGHTCRTIVYVVTVANMPREQLRTLSTWRTGEQGTLTIVYVVTVANMRTVENAEYMENWRTRNIGHTCRTISGTLRTGSAQYVRGRFATTPTRPGWIDKR